MRSYLAALNGRDFRRLWLGASLSLLGDGMTFVALAWLVLDRPGGTRQLGLLAVLAAPRTLAVAAGFLVIGAFSAPMTVWAQSLRMERVPPSLRGRTFALLRTLMQATPPVGAAAVTPLLVRGQLGAAAALMGLLAGLPALGLLLLPVPGQLNGVRGTPGCPQIGQMLKKATKWGAGDVR